MNKLTELTLSVFIILLLSIKICISQYSMAESSTDQSLPVELVSFLVQQDEFAVLLNWKTASELDNVGFYIERQTSLNFSFIEIADYQSDPRLIGQGNSTQLHDYHFVDFIEKEGRYTYRLYQVDSNGERNLIATESIDVKFSTIKNFSLIGIYPNPFNSSTQIEFYLPESFKSEIKIYNISGQKVDEISPGILTSGIQKIRWDASSHPAGFYFLTLRFKSVQITQKVLYLK